MWQFTLYNLLIQFYFGSIRMASLFSKSAFKFTSGRKDWKFSLQKFQEEYAKRNQRIWIHAASLGEFEQGRELIEMIRKHHQEWVIILSFFSPSGFEKRKDYDQVDWVCYFPSDRFHDAETFIEGVAPSLVLFIKYDFWFNTLQILHKKKIPFYFVSSLFRSNHFLLHPLLKPLLYSVLKAQAIFVQDQNSKSLLEQSAGKVPVIVTGDTRIDRVMRIASQNLSFNWAIPFCYGKKILVAGSVWKTDLEILLPAFKELIRHDWNILMVPHQLEHGEMEWVERKFGTAACRLSNYHNDANIRILIIDQVGLLAHVYRYGDMALVGGGFGKGIHNILEPAAHGLPVLFGPRFNKFPEAPMLIDFGAAFCVNHSEAFLQAKDHIFEHQEEIKEKIHAYFASHSGATQRVYDYIKHHLIA